MCLPNDSDRSSKNTSRTAWIAATMVLACLAGPTIATILLTWLGGLLSLG